MLPPVPWRCWRPDLSAATPSSASSTRCSGQSHPSPDDACRLVEAMTLKQTLEAFEALDSARASGRTCQSALNWAPLSASKRDPFERLVLAVALAPSELAGVATTARARAGT